MTGAAGSLREGTAKRPFRTIIGCRDLATLVVAIERDHGRRRHADATRTLSREVDMLVAT